MEFCSMGCPFNARSFFPNRDSRTIPGVVLWRGYFQSERPAIINNRMLINVNISTGAMYQHGELIPLCLKFLGKSGKPRALTAGRDQFPEPECRRLQKFRIRVTTPYGTHNPKRQRLVKGLTPKSARNRTFDTGDGHIMTVTQYFYTRLKKDSNSRI